MSKLVYKGRIKLGRFKTAAVVAADSVEEAALLLGLDIAEVEKTESRSEIRAALKEIGTVFYEDPKYRHKFYIVYQKLETKL